MILPIKNLGLPEFKSTVENAFVWRLWHGINYMIGGVTFFFGSVVYFPAIDAAVNGDVLAGWLYTIGSACFLLADLTEWNHFRTGCVGETNGNKNGLDQSLRGIFKRAEMGLNFFTSVTGSTMYLIGSIFFIPSTNMLLAGEQFFIWGSFVIVVAQTWKLYRTAATDYKNNNSTELKWENCKEDLLGFFVDLFAGLGGFCYMIGTVFFKYADRFPSFYLTAVVLFVFGGTFFSLSGIYMQRRYFFSLPQPLSLP